MTDFLGRRYDNGLPVRVRVAAGKIAAVEPLTGQPDVASLPWIAPGLIDMQVNGYGGVEFNSPDLTTGHVRQVCDRLLAFGVTRFLATCTTDSYEHFEHSFRVLAEARRTDSLVAASIAGIHQEGPHISPVDGPRGAHPLVHVRPPDVGEYERLQQAADGSIKLITISPEYDSAPDFIRRVVTDGVIVAIGHTNANSAQIAAAVAAGATMSTHLGNGAHPLIKRHPNYIWDQLADDRLTASLIVDGHHLPPAVVKSMVRAKTLSRVVLVSDLTGLAGMPAGRYDSPLGSVELLPEGKLVVAGQRDLLAGAAMCLPGNVVNLQKFAELDQRAAIDAASVRPAALLGETSYGLNPGSRADFFLFQTRGEETPAEAQWKVQTTVQLGEAVYDTLSNKLPA